MPAPPPFAPSTRYEGWINGLRLPWLGLVGRRIWGGFAAAVGDRTIDWLRQGLLEHLPKWASSTSLGLIASERQLDVGPYDTDQALADREPYAVALSKFYGSPLGLLLGLHFAGFDGAVVVHQNGQAHRLTLPLPTFQDNWDPTPSHLITALGANPNLQGDALNHAWWTFDTENSFCSRFAILFPGSSGPFTTRGRAVFSGTDNAAVTWNNPVAFADTNYVVYPSMPVITDNPADGVIVWNDGTAQTKTGTLIRASDTFTGYVDLLAAPASENPYAWLTAADLQRLQGVIAKWEPRKSTCMGVYVLVQGSFGGWPVTDTTGGATGSPGTIVYFPGA